jgi:hypothetical protein
VSRTTQMRGLNPTQQPFRLGSVEAGPHVFRRIFSVISFGAAVLMASVSADGAAGKTTAGCDVRVPRGLSKNR